MTNRASASRQALVRSPAGAGAGHLLLQAGPRSPPWLRRSWLAATVVPCSGRFCRRPVARPAVPLGGTVPINAAVPEWDTPPAGLASAGRTAGNGSTGPGRLAVAAFALLLIASALPARDRHPQRDARPACRTGDRTRGIGAPRRRRCPATPCPLLGVAGRWGSPRCGWPTSSRTRTGLCTRILDQPDQRRCGGGPLLHHPASLCAIRTRLTSMTRRRPRREIQAGLRRRAWPPPREGRHAAGARAIAAAGLNRSGSPTTMCWRRRRASSALRTDAGAPSVSDPLGTASTRCLAAWRRPRRRAARSPRAAWPA
jgi:hypothetical protein